jgi:hypothetical protein
VVVSEDVPMGWDFTGKLRRRANDEQERKAGGI